MGNRVLSYVALGVLLAGLGTSVPTQASEAGSSETASTAGAEMPDLIGVVWEWVSFISPKEQIEVAEPGATPWSWPPMARWPCRWTAIGASRT